ncbi:hypothetical protein Ahy_A08g040737 isoform A [Arachis hypogaea]|uniref:peptidyl-tRNA hydrolase n=1 Tax=Arachis hypogaea TaxID=3818 RepID=A0A445C070_ARAHY|nr:hypothetical protein Ahy_A08g040737 isoform A [Arachis hypogaea]
MSQPLADSQTIANQTQSPSENAEVVLQYVVLRRDLIDTWPLGSVVTQGCHASVSAVWSNKDDPLTIDYCSPEKIDSMHKALMMRKYDMSINVRVRCLSIQQRCATLIKLPFSPWTTLFFVPRNVYAVYTVLCRHHEPPTTTISTVLPPSSKCYHMLSTTTATFLCFLFWFLLPVLRNIREKVIVNLWSESLQQL